ncbi:hypothetical protein [Aquella oligotrophica]|uniref:Uncharacterized protein n=1 Tax=Aquella oligotrophica TaxID=2067065 RepID=A0A2I7N6K1_9NEIS|nr:hypothetical protein [Aquella oligotrophica]AUR52050.1 hypothetical protein CUN60_06970 [Aquella oligotrophica]
MKKTIAPIILSLLLTSCSGDFMAKEVECKVARDQLISENMSLKDQIKQYQLSNSTLIKAQVESREKELAKKANEFDQLKKQLLKEDDEYREHLRLLVSIGFGFIVILLVVVNLQLAKRRKAKAEKDKAGKIYEK